MIEGERQKYCFSIFFPWLQSIKFFHVFVRQNYTIIESQEGSRIIFWSIPEIRLPVSVPRGEERAQ